MTQQLAKPVPALSTIVIVGVGLIGGSIGAALKERHAADRIVGVGRQQTRLDAACSQGLIDACQTDPRAAAAEADLIIFCTPVDRIAAGVREVASACRPGTVITDVGSVKGPICDALAAGFPSGVGFVGSHPVAGSEKGGFEHSKAGLFAGRTCVITPVETTSRAAVARVAEFWKLLGANVVEMSPAAHDRALAETSHLPHLIAAALASTLAAENKPLTATGFRDTTRIAAGDPDLWTAILLGNADELLRSLDKHTAILQQFRQALEARDPQQLATLLAKAKTNRDALSST